MRPKNNQKKKEKRLEEKSVNSKALTERSDLSQCKLNKSANITEMLC